jgi:hypothetical protein
VSDPNCRSEFKTTSAHIGANTPSKPELEAVRRFFIAPDDSPRFFFDCLTGRQAAGRLRPINIKPGKQMQKFASIRQQGLAQYLQALNLSDQLEEVEKIDLRYANISLPRTIFLLYFSSPIHVLQRRAEDRREGGEERRGPVDQLRQLLGGALQPGRPALQHEAQEGPQRKKKKNTYMHVLDRTNVSYVFRVMAL